MNAHYYFSWFEGAFPNKLAPLINKDLKHRKSLVMITTLPSDYAAADDDKRLYNEEWFIPAGIIFDECHMIDYRISKEETHKLIESASAVFLCGGNTIALNGFIFEYELADKLKNSDALIMGASAGAINMGAKWLCGKSTGYYKEEENVIYDGAGLDNIYLCSMHNLDVTSSSLQADLTPMSESLDVYVAYNEGAIRIKDGKVDVLGEVYLVRHSVIEKMDETI